ncbi:hypothetical protein [Mesorhizobium sp. L-8-3]|uniref:hypothetical protein n=1 Tax=Mesorhizobium sp. L-8-3 TaxID=2744522 RepID=UPI00192951A4|nr:hypothetical protein [Mesorhizobium sp. L-8-3]
MTNSSGDLKYYFEMSKVDMKIFGMKFGHVIFHAISKSCVDRVDRFYLEGPRDEPSGESAGWRTQAMLLRERQPTRFREPFFPPSGSVLENLHRALAFPPSHRRASPSPPPASLPPSVSQTPSRSAAASS